MIATRHPEKKRIRLLLGVIVAVIAGWLIFSPYGYKRVSETSRQLKEVRAANERFAEENKALEKEIERLEKDSAYVEEVARKQHGLVKKGELIFEFKEDK